MIAEEWRPVVGYEGTYKVSSHGRMKSIDRMCGRMFVHGKMRSISPRRDGYVSVGLRRGGDMEMGYMHRIVAIAFLGDMSGYGLEVCHGPGGPSDNRLSNLRWDTHAGNMAETRGVPKVKGDASSLAMMLAAAESDRDKWRQVALRLHAAATSSATKGAQ